jgi:O-antigen ligase
VLAYYKENIQLYILLLFWLIVGMYAGVFIYAVLPLSMYLMWKKGMYEELFIGYLFILIISDSLDDRLLFAKSVKNIYISLLALLFFLNMEIFPALNKLVKLFLPFFLFSVITLCCSISEPFFLTSLEKTISYFLTFLIVPSFFLKLFTDGGPPFLRRFLLFCATLFFAGFVLKYVAHGIVYIESGRYRGIMGNPNGLGIFALLAYIVFFLIDDFFPKLFEKKERILIYSVILLSIFMTSSRNAVFAVMIFYICQRFFSRSTFLGFILFLVMLLLAEVVSNNLTTIISSLGLGDYFRINTLQDGSGRYIAWAFAWKHIQENFFIGKGFSYNEYYMRQYYGLLNKLGHQGGIHNSFLTFWMDQGLIGLIIYVRSYILMFISAAKRSKYAFPIMFAISFTAIFESWLVGSLSAYAFLSLVIFSIITSDEILIAREVELAEWEIARKKLIQ